MVEKVIIWKNETYNGAWSVYYGNGAVECPARGLLAFADNSITCAVLQLPFILETIGFGYLASLISTIIIIISIFGGIKDNYKWFILNQAIWDLLISYDFICDKPSHRYFTSMKPEISEQWNQGPSTCFYIDPKSERGSFMFYLKQFMATLTNYGSYVTLLLLAFSRFLALFCHHFYDRHFKNTKIVVIIFIFNCITVILITFTNLSQNLFPYSSQTWFQIKSSFQPVTILSSLILSFILTFAIVFKICCQLRYQLQHNRKHLIASLRVAFVLLFQCFTIFVFFCCTIVYTSITQVSLSFKINLMQILFNNHFPNWIILLSESPKTLNILRVFLDSIVILTILTGYRKSMNEFFKFLISLFSNPKLAIFKIKAKLNGNKTRVFVIKSKNDATSMVQSIDR